MGCLVGRAVLDLAAYAAPDNKQTDALARRRARLALRDHGSGVCEVSACAMVLLIQRVGAAVACICRPSCLRELINLLLGNAGKIGHDLGRAVMIEGQGSGWFRFREIRWVGHCGNVPAATENRQDAIPAYARQGPENTPMPPWTGFLSSGSRRTQCAAPAVKIARACRKTQDACHLFAWRVGQVPDTTITCPHSDRPCAPIARPVCRSKMHGTGQISHHKRCVVHARYPGRCHVRIRHRPVAMV